MYFGIGVQEIGGIVMMRDSSTEVSSIKDCFNKINNGDITSVAILVFGVDNDLNNRIGRYCTHNLKDSLIIESKQIGERFEKRNLIVVMSDRDSIDQLRRKNEVIKLKESGIMNIIGIYVKCFLINLEQTKVFPNLHTKLTRRNNFIGELESNPPVPDEFEYYFEISNI